MLQTKKINDNVVAVSWEPSYLYLRESGREYFGKERLLLSVNGGELVIHKDIADQFGINIEIKE